MTAISVNKYIYKLLSEDAELNELVNSAIYPLIAEESTSFPFIIFRRTNLVTSYSKDGCAGDEVEFAVQVAAQDYFTTVEIMERVRKILELHRDNYFKTIRLSSVTEDFVENAYIQEISFIAQVNNN